MRLAMISALLLLMSMTAARAEPFVTKQMLKPDRDGMPGEQICRGDVDLGAGLKLPFALAGTNKGNGTLEIANLKLRILDDYDDSMIYDGSLLNAEIVSLDETDGKYLIISGTAIHTGEKGNERLPEGVFFIYRFDRVTKTFSRVYKHAGFDL